LKKKLNELERIKQAKIKEDEERKLRGIAEQTKIKREEDERKKIEDARRAAEEKIIKEAEARAKELQDKERARLEAEALKKRQEEEARKRAADELAARQRAEAEEAARKRAEQERINRREQNRAWLQNSVYPGVPFYTALGTQVLPGRMVKIAHWNTKMVLHSHGNRYDTGSRNSEVTGFWVRDDNDWFTLDVIQGGLQNNGIIAFRHILTGGSIIIDPNYRSPTTNQFECSNRGRIANNDLWYFRITIESSWFGEDDKLRVGDFVKFINPSNNLSLHSHNLRNRVTQQQEVTGYNNRDSNDMWIIIETK